MAYYRHKLLSLETADNSTAVVGHFSISPPILVGEAFSKTVVGRRSNSVVLEHVMSTDQETIFRCETDSTAEEYVNRDTVHEMGLRVLDLANDPATAVRRNY